MKGSRFEGDRLHVFLLRSTLLLGLVVLAGCSSVGDEAEGEPDVAGSAGAEVGSSQAGSQPNILLLIADDYGVEASVCYPVDNGGEAVPLTPRIAELCSTGMVYENAWSSPTCSPTRSGILTGRHGFRTGVTEQSTRENAIEIRPEELTLPRVLDAVDSGYRHASFGKWHLGGGSDNPNTMGWGHFSGLLVGGLQDYSNWTKTVNGEEVAVDRYATTEIVDDTLAWIGSGEEPWLAWVAFNAPHTPFHLPPADLHSADLSGTAADIEADPLPYYHAAVEALDTEIGRLLDSLDPDVRSNTMVIFIGDNGSPGGVTSHRRGQAKGGLYEGGIHVPLVVAGPGVSAGRSEALVGTIDLFATMLAMTGVDASSAVGEVVVDSVDFSSTLDGADGGSEVIMSEIFGVATRENRGGKTIRDAQYKVIDFASGRTELFDLERDPRGEDAIDPAAFTEAESQAHDRLLATLRTWTADPNTARPPS